MVFNRDEYDHHERIVFCTDEATGLQAIVAVHSTALGPAAGGCRMWPYETPDDALDDALRLSRAMTAKNALAGLPLGGGKSVIIGDPHADVDANLFRAFGRCVAELDGRYWTAEDVGVGLDRVRRIAETNPFTFGVETGDPSPYTAYGTVKGMEAALEHATGVGSVEGQRVALQGVGNVGGHLARLLHERGAKLIVADVDDDALEAVADLTGADAVAPDEIYDVDADIFAPCALGGSINAATIPRLRAGIVAGCANNQLAHPEDGARLRRRGIVYAPDYVINSGGMLSAAGPIVGHRDEGEEAIRARLDHIGVRLLEILERAERDGRPPSDVADAMAAEIVAAAA
ncbi:MAG: amino acid dehydrogenase [Acidimicrobiia bacterium]|nr:amino acid dehydrogenase [Acidimicrobiia bacterium]